MVLQLLRPVEPNPGEAMTLDRLLEAEAERQRLSAARDKEAMLGRGKRRRAIERTLQQKTHECLRLWVKLRHEPNGPW